MKKVRIRFIIVIAITLLTAGFIAQIGYEPPLENSRFFDFPMVIGEWKGEEVPMAGYVYQSLETRYSFMRNYRSDRYSSPVNLSLVWFDDRMVAFHAPEACLGGVGINIVEKSPVKVKLNGRDCEINKLVAIYNNSEHVVLYFFDVEGEITTSQSVIRLNILKRRLQFKRASATFVRIMAPLESNEEKITNEMLDFLNAIYPLLPSYTYTDMITDKQ
ncbi:MAG TPA: EpsI family protein [Desulfomonilia bacterium]